MNLGAHVSTANGYRRAFAHLMEIGGACMQLFSASPQSWVRPVPDPARIEEFRDAKRESGVEPVYFHAPYLINLADNGRIGDASVQALTAELTLAARLGVRGSIIHLGSFKEKTIAAPLLASPSEKYEMLVGRMRDVLAHTPPETHFIIENSGTRKIGVTLDEIAKIIRLVRSERVRVCLDTCHLHAAGYNLSTAEHLDAFLAEFDKKIGLGRLEAWHMNDSRDPFGSFRDRHENIGEGYLERNEFTLLLTHPALSRLPFIIETPGFDGQGPDKKNLDILKKLAQMKKT